MYTLESSLRWHLQCNHYPPVPTCMVPVCVQAIDFAVADEWDAHIELPENTYYKGMNTAPVHAIVEQHHLHYYVESCMNGED